MHNSKEEEKNLLFSGLSTSSGVINLIIIFAFCWKIICKKILNLNFHYIILKPNQVTLKKVIQEASQNAVACENINLHQSARKEVIIHTVIIVVVARIIT